MNTTKKGGMGMKRWLAGALALGMCFFIGCGNNGNVPEEPQVEAPKTAAEIKAEAIQEEISTMPTEEKIGQLLMADFRKNTDGSGMTVLSGEV